MNLELAAMLCVTRRLPQVVGSAHIVGMLSNRYVRKPRPKECVSVMGFQVELDPMELVDRLVMFAPHLYDRREIAYLRRNLSEGGVFLDLGCNIGLYSLAASLIVGKSGRVLAVEADPHSYNKLARTIEDNRIENLEVVQVGLSDRIETLMLRLQLEGNRGGSTFLDLGKTKDNTVSVQCKPLLDVLHDAGIERVHAAKLDVEGFEFRVLRAFFETANRSLWPNHLIVERNRERNVAAGGDVNDLLAERGYSLQFQHGDNYVWRSDEV